MEGRDGFVVHYTFFHGMFACEVGVRGSTGNEQLRRMLYAYGYLFMENGRRCMYVC